MNKRAVLLQQGWGLAPIYLGQQETGPGSHHVDGPHGEADGADAVALAQQAELPASSIIYLDIETGGPLSTAMTEYLQRWAAAVTAAGFTAGAYLSHTTADSARRAVPTLKLWVFRVKIADTNVDKDPPFFGGLPAESGAADAVAWQWAQNCRVPKPGGRLIVDLNVASNADPSRA